MCDAVLIHDEDCRVIPNRIHQRCANDGEGGLVCQYAGVPGHAWLETQVFICDPNVNTKSTRGCVHIRRDFDDVSDKGLTGKRICAHLTAHPECNKADLVLRDLGEHHHIVDCAELKKLLADSCILAGIHSAGQHNGYCRTYDLCILQIDLCLHHG